MKPFVLGAIFARGGSKGIKKKNIRLLNKKPLIAYAIETALAVSEIDALIVSTDNEEIAAVARQYGAQVPFMRPKALATDHSPELLSWQHAIETFEKIKKQKVGVLVSIPTTSPLRKPQDVRACLQSLLKEKADVAITVCQAHRSPYFNMVKINNDGYAHLVMNSHQKIVRRQEAPQVFDMTTVAYAAKASFVRRAKSLFDGKVRAVVVPSERSLDIDTPLDFEMAGFLMKKAKTR